MFARAARRDVPLEVDETDLQTPRRQSTIVALPEGYRIASLPGDADLRFGKAHSSFRFTAEGERVVCERELFLPRMSVAPEDIAAFNDFLAAVAAKELENVTLVATEVR